MLPADRIDPASAPLDGRDVERLAQIEPSLDAGLELRRWWLATFGNPVDELTESSLQRILQSNRFDRVFRLTQPRQVWPENLNFGFFHQADLRGQKVPIFGLVQQAFFDRPMLARGEPINRWQAALRQFVWHHFLSSTNFVNQDLPYSEPRYRGLDRYLEPFSWNFSEDDAVVHQDRSWTTRLYYKRRRNAQVGKFWRTLESDLDLDQVTVRGPFEWVVLQNRSQVQLSVSPAISGSAPYFAIPQVLTRCGVLHPEFLEIRESGLPPQVRAVYAFGFAMGRGAEGPESYQPGFSEVRFQLMADGRILARLTVVQKRFQRLSGTASLPQIWGLLVPWKGLRQALAPLPGVGSLVESITGPDLLQTYIVLANLLTRGWAARNLGISFSQLERRQLTTGAIDFARIIDQVLYIWRVVPDWTDRPALPRWAILNKRPP